jgi:CheY-like chemotaxis protein
MWASALERTARSVEVVTRGQLSKAISQADVLVLPEGIPAPERPGLVWRCSPGSTPPGPCSVPMQFARPSAIREVVMRAVSGLPQTRSVPVREAPRFEGRRVLVVDDNAINCRLAESLLRRQGCVVEVAHDGREALERWARGSFELVLMDCNMPEVDGLEATRRIREIEKSEGRARTPVVALTADAMDSEREHCLSAGMDDHVSKPVREERLREVLSHYLATKERVSSG